MSDTEFVNLYIEKQAMRISELIKNEILLSTHLEIAQKVVNNLNEQLEQAATNYNSLQNQYNEAVTMYETSLAKKASKIPKVEDASSF